MKFFDYEKLPSEFLNPDIVGMLTKIHEHKGKQELFLEAHADKLITLLEIAKIQSTGASNRIEGIFANDNRLKQLVEKKSTPRNRSEEEISGYRDVLETIHERYEYIDVKPNITLQFHKQLYSFSKTTLGGYYKNGDNKITETDEFGNRKIRFDPVSSFLTPQSMDNLYSAFLSAYNLQKHDPLILIPMFILDFLCIHPFNDGNGRMSRLLTLLLLYKSGYIVGKYISIEKLIENTKDVYYDSLQSSSFGWHKNKNDYLPFLRYSLGILIKAYNEFEDRVEHLRHRKLSKPDRIKHFIDNNVGKFTKKDISNKYPDISKITVDRTISNLVKSGYILKVGIGRSTSYIKNNADIIYGGDNFYGGENIGLI